MFAQFLISKISLRCFPPLALSISVTAKPRRTLLLHSCLQYKTLICHNQITHDLLFHPETGYIMATLLHGIFFQCCSHPLALLSTLLAPPSPCSDPSSSFLGTKGWHNATSLFLFKSSCFAAQDLITLDTVFHSGRYFRDLQVLSRFLACLGRNPFLVGGLLSATAQSYISALKYIVFAWAHAILIVLHQRHPLYHLIISSLHYLQTSIGSILYTFLSCIWMSWAKSTNYQWLFTYSISSQDLLVIQFLILLIRSVHIFYHSMAWTKMAWRSQINYINSHLCQANLQPLWWKLSLYQLGRFSMYLDSLMQIILSPWIGFS